MKTFTFWFFTIFLSTIIILEFYILYREYVKNKIIKSSDTARIYSKYSSIYNVTETILGKDHNNLPLDYIRENKLFQKHMTYYILHNAFTCINSYGPTFYILTFGYMDYLNDTSRNNIVKAIRAQIEKKYTDANCIDITFDYRAPEQIRITTYFKG